MSADFTPIRLPGIQDRHRGGLATTWEDYAAWLEQKVAALTRANAVVEVYESEAYGELPRPRRRLAARARIRR